MAEENNKYISAYKGTQIDRAYEAIHNISSDLQGHVVTIDQYGNLKGDDSITVNSLALRTTNWQGHVGNLLIQGEEGVVAPSEKKPTDFLKAINLEELGANGNLPMMEVDIDGITINLVDSNINYTQITSDHQTLQRISNIVGDTETSGTILFQINDLYDKISSLEARIELIENQYVHVEGESAESEE